jgi:phosphatidylinositol-bisphosphatase
MLPNISSKEAFVFPESVKEDEWMRAVSGHLHPEATYCLVRHVRLVGMLLIVYCRPAAVHCSSTVN